MSKISILRNAPGAIPSVRTSSVGWWGGIALPRNRSAEPVPNLRAAPLRTRRLRVVTAVLNTNPRPRRIPSLMGGTRVVYGAGGSVGRAVGRAFAR